MKDHLRRLQEQASCQGAASHDVLELKGFVKRRVPKCSGGVSNLWRQDRNMAWQPGVVGMSYGATRITALLGRHREAQEFDTVGYPKRKSKVLAISHARARERFAGITVAHFLIQGLPTQW